MIKRKESVRAHTQPPVLARLALTNLSKNRDKQLTFIVRVMVSLLFYIVEIKNPLINESFLMEY
jgi:hypothetical protein